MKTKIKKILRQLREKFLRPWTAQIEQQEKILKNLIDVNLRNRAIFKQDHNQAIHVLLVCHTPVLWNMFDSLYRVLDKDPDFSVTVAALPYHRGTLPEGVYKDEGVYDFLKEKGVNVIQGYNKDKDQWLDPATLNADYVFFQTPYRFFPDIWSIERVSVFARVCYLPYGTVLENGIIGDISHPELFLKNTSLFFMEALLTRKLFTEKFHNKYWYVDKKVIVSGLPKYDRIKEIKNLHGKVWKRGMESNFKRILWSTRWRTEEGTCHFFDYKDYFFEFCDNHQDVDFVFRPHPLFSQNFIKTGEMTFDEQTQMKKDYDNSPNMFIDMNKDYADTFMTSDMLITDLSSLMIEYLITEKPIIYTHRKNTFNEIGQKLSEGVYWVRNARELDETISMTLSGYDPLREKRKELMRELVSMPKEGSGEFIKESLRANMISHR